MNSVGELKAWYGKVIVYLHYLVLLLFAVADNGKKSVV